ncbi:Hypothetical predicted protein [Cloeon dipterum]|uniref:Uncharacterized protein n=1 Tax=Cloeon dipterum TaxID=197152 RepID=A0A8S1E3T6_9INSE|nr:Hypothetical predicted protein [Cloeon dipterum]
MEFFRTLVSLGTSENVATTLSTEDALQLTKKRLQNLRRRRLGLQQLAVREISKQLTFYLTHPDELEKLKSLPGALRDKILQVLMKRKCFDKQGEKMEFENLKEFFPLLLSPRTRYIELNGILTFCPGWYTDKESKNVIKSCVELLKQIEARAPNVETLVINRNNPFDTDNQGIDATLGNAEFNQDMVKSLLKMQNLNRLNVNVYFIQLTDVLKICKNLSRLEYINVGMIMHDDYDKPAIEEVLTSFRNLKELIFEIFRGDHDWLGCICTQNLPNIELVQYDPNKISEWIHLHINSGRYHGLDFPGASNLRHIFMNGRRDSSEVKEAMPTLFPKVTCLMVKNISCPSLEEHVMPNFNNIRQLQLLDSCGSENFEKYLTTYGQKLQSLYLGNGLEDSTIDLESIFKFCPKLEKLSLVNVCLKTPPSKSKLELFAELMELEWVFYFNHSCFAPIDQQMMVLSNILSAPKLEKVKLEGRFLNEKDLLILNSLIQEKRILKNLHTLRVYFNYQISEAFANVLKSACAFLPKLTDFRFGLRNKREDPILANQSIVSSDSVCEMKMNGVFESEN